MAKSLEINDTLLFKEDASTVNGSINAFDVLEKSVFSALETYSNVHRGSGHFSRITTHLYERARQIVLDYLNLDKKKYVVIFCTPSRSEIFKTQLHSGSYHELTGSDTGLSLGVNAIAVKKEKLPKGTPFETGGGTTLLVSQKWALWVDAPDKFEAGTPAIINSIAFARALQLISQEGTDIFTRQLKGDASVYDLLYHDGYEQYAGDELLSLLRNKLIGSNINVPTLNGPKAFINLDYSASTPALEPVFRTFMKVLKQPAEVQSLIIPEVKAIIATFLNADPDEYDVIFTSNTTESVNLVAKQFDTIANRHTGSDANTKSQSVIVNSFIEHSSNDLPWRYIDNSSLLRIDVDNEGYFDRNALDRLLIEYNEEKKYGAKRIKLVTITGASNVLGICNDLKQIGEMVKKYGALFMVDAAQLIAHRKIDMTACNIDLLVFSAHKIYAPFGTGVLIARKGMIKHTETLPENIPGIAALGKSLLLLSKVGMSAIEEHEVKLTRKVLKKMALIPNMLLFGMKDSDAPDFHPRVGVVSFSFTNLFAVKIARQLALYRAIGIRFGCHCAHLIVKRLAGLNAVTEEIQKYIITLFPNMKLPGVARISLGIGTTEEEIDQLVETLRVISMKNKIEKTKVNAVKQEIKEFIKGREQKVYSN